ncbi:MAG: hypothetical protein RL685_6447 [Pseudomonadota bacterium]
MIRVVASEDEVSRPDDVEAARPKRFDDAKPDPREQRR